MCLRWYFVKSAVSYDILLQDNTVNTLLLNHTLQVLYQFARAYSGLVRPRIGDIDRYWSCWNIVRVLLLALALALAPLVVVVVVVVVAVAVAVVDVDVNQNIPEPCSGLWTHMKTRMRMRMMIMMLVTTLSSWLRPQGIPRWPQQCSWLMTCLWRPIGRMHFQPQCPCQEECTLNISNIDWHKERPPSEKSLFHNDYPLVI